MIQRSCTKSVINSLNASKIHHYQNAQHTKKWKISTNNFQAKFQKLEVTSKKKNSKTILSTENPLPTIPNATLGIFKLLDL